MSEHSVFPSMISVEDFSDASHPYTGDHPRARCRFSKASPPSHRLMRLTMLANYTILKRLCSLSNPDAVSHVHKFGVYIIYKIHIFVARSLDMGNSDLSGIWVRGKGEEEEEEEEKEKEKELNWGKSSP